MSVVPPISPRTKHKPITDKQRQLLVMLANGVESKEAAYQLGVIHDTVYRRVVHLRQKFDARNNTHLVAIAIRRGLV